MVYSKFDELLVDLGVEQIPINGINIEDMVCNYFNQKFPFEKKKTDEFKNTMFL